MDYTQKADELTFSSDPDYEYTIKAKKIHKENYGRYSMVGKLRSKKTRKVYMDIVDHLCEIPKSAILLFNEIKANRDEETNIAVMKDWQYHDATQQRAANKRLFELKKTDLVLKVRQINGLLPKVEKYSYMINPHLLKPWQYEYSKIVWKALKFTHEKQEVSNE